MRPWGRSRTVLPSSKAITQPRQRVVGLKPMILWPCNDKAWARNSQGSRWRALL
jgi:hypothetical protein